MSPFKPTRPHKVFFNKNCLDEPQIKNLKEQSHILSKMSRNVKIMWINFIELKEDNNKYLRDVRENTNTKLGEIIRTIQGLKSQIQ